RWRCSSGRTARSRPSGRTTSRRRRRDSRRRPGTSASFLARRAPGRGRIAVNVVITPAMLAQVVVSGILAGALYAMVALGLALIFGVMHVINIAHGPLLMLGAYTTFFIYQAFGLNPYL